MRILGVFALLLSFVFSGCSKKPSGPEVWIYTSAYAHVVRAMEGVLQKKFPGVTFRWYQSGSENVAAKVSSEILAGKTQADLVLTSDPFWYEGVKRGGHFLEYSGPSSLPKQWRDPQGYFAIVRIPAMVIAYHSDVFPKDQAPKNFSDLVASRFKDKVIFGSPLESGTTFTSVALLARKNGWDFFTKLRDNGALSVGGNASALTRIETKERPVGLVLLENVLAIKDKNPAIQEVYPQDGAILVPSPIAILKQTRDPELSKRVADAFFEPEIQGIFVDKGGMYSPIPDFRSPAGAVAFEKVLPTALRCDAQSLNEIFSKRDEIKMKFSKLMLE